MEQNSIGKNETFFDIHHESDIPKYQQLVNAINNAIAENVLQRGDVLPSVNKICKANALSRDTVFKAYSILKENGVIESVPNKGYYVANETKRVLLVLDTFKAYKEVLYHSFVNNISNNIIVDLQFHHYNIDNFKTIVNNSIGKYYKYVIMNFENESIPNILTKIPNDKLLLIDWNIYARPTNNYVFQDFGNAFYNVLKESLHLFKKYKELVFVYPNYSDHPKETLEFFIRFCRDFNIESKTIRDLKDFKIQKEYAYISTSDRFLGLFLEKCKDNNLEPGKEVGILSYNETPMKKFIYKGITVVSTDFRALGTRAAEFVTEEKELKQYIPTKLILRESL
ncbi:GntR family transcriptional regulator [Polaribacter sp. Asnod1-A03]|uniref:GntR family transcriptional regulator n=1 Tax=Polaribacter sp. Asnod1-A03 TaxID=3160581 RepID=UPI0038632D5C